jgi:hypothetical protein
MAELTDEEKMRLVRKQAKDRGLGIKFDPRLTSTPYRAMNPTIGKILDQPYEEKALTYGAHSEAFHDVPMDLNHENIEDWEAKRLLKKGVPKEKIYPRAHKIANAKQRNFRFMEGKK